MTFDTYGGVSVSLIAYHGIGIAKCDPSPTASWRIRAGLHFSGTGVWSHDALKGTDPESWTLSPPTPAGRCPCGGDLSGSIVGAYTGPIFFRTGPVKTSNGCGEARPANRLRFLPGTKGRSDILKTHIQTSIRNIRIYTTHGLAYNLLSFSTSEHLLERSNDGKLET